MLSFKQLQEKKTKIKINPKKDEIVEGQKKKKDDTYLETDFKKRQANNEKARKDLAKGPQMKNPHFESTEDAYDSQEEVSEESNQEIEAETEIPFLTFGEYQKTKTMDEEQLKEFNLMKMLTGGGAKNTAKPSPSQMAVGAMQNSARQGGMGLPLQRMVGRNDATAAAYKQLLGRSKGGKVPAKKVRKEEVEGVDESVTKMASMKRKPNQGSRSMAGRAGMAGSPSAGVKKPAAPAPKSNFMSSMIGGMKGPLGGIARSSIKPGGGNALGVQSAATSAGGGKYFTNNARLLARNPASYTRGVVPSAGGSQAPTTAAPPSLPKKSKGGKVEKKKVRKEETQPKPYSFSMQAPSITPSVSAAPSVSTGAVKGKSTPKVKSSSAAALSAQGGTTTKKLDVVKSQPKKAIKSSFHMRSFGSFINEDRAEDAKASLEKVKKRQEVLDAHEKKTGKKLDITKSPEHKEHKKNFPGAKRTGKKVRGAKETPLETHNRRVNKYSERLRKYGKTKKQDREDKAMAKHTSRFD